MSRSTRGRITVFTEKDQDIHLRPSSHDATEAQIDDRMRSLENSLRVLIAEIAELQPLRSEVADLRASDARAQARIASLEKENRQFQMRLEDFTNPPLPSLCFACCTLMPPNVLLSNNTPCRTNSCPRCDKQGLEFINMPSNAESACRRFTEAARKWAGAVHSKKDEKTILGLKNQVRDIQAEVKKCCPVKQTRSQTTQTD
ncbi:hypothetical protein F5Y18DRAFT_439717 [Xylariaceae sp. FL1019]|nr:hypothetical protein F5Y18DRAFT_439717 [Xylariaceae sp. FL1019]